MQSGSEQPGRRVQCGRALQRVKRSRIGNWLIEEPGEAPSAGQGPAPQGTRSNVGKLS